LVKAKVRQRKAEKIRGTSPNSIKPDSQARREKNLHTPNLIPLIEFTQQDVRRPGFPRSRRAQNCYICKQDYTTIHHFLTTSFARRAAI